MDTPPRTREPSPGKTALDNPGQKPHFASLHNRDLQRLQELHRGMEVVLNGRSLTLADVVAVAKYGARVRLNDSSEVLQCIDASIETLKKHLDGGHIVYGVTTGFGGSASTRTDDTEALQRALVQHQNTGILTNKDRGLTRDEPGLNDFEVDFDTESQPTSWVRASMLVRCNSLIRGHSAVRYDVANKIVALLNCNLTPVVPLRGSISASGDLSPLSYIAGAVEGNHDIYVRIGPGNSKITTADLALKNAGLEPVVLKAKEGLGLLNGTAFSSATAALALHQATQLATLAQVLTSMNVEALTGTAESFWPKIAEMRPHPGQIEASATILSYLRSSKLARCVEKPKDTKATGLYQDRYALRTSSQWIGPQLEDLALSRAQMQLELNSTTDNPLVDTENDHILHGGNFQAAVVTSAMDRTRLCLEKLGRMIFAQSTELIDVGRNNGLPANLSSDEPSLSFTCKGVDINLASYASELGFLAGPVGNHVHTAEQSNQSINSIALISSRYTFQALDVLRMMCAASLFVACQALDLRVLQLEFMQQVENQARDLTSEHFRSGSETQLFSSLWAKIMEIWPRTGDLDLPQRAEKTAKSTIEVIVQYLAESTESHYDTKCITNYSTALARILETTYNGMRQQMYNDHASITPKYLGVASQKVYNFVRKELGLAFHRGLIEHPTQPVDGELAAGEAAKRQTIGTQISVIHEALKDGRIASVVVQIPSTS